MDYRLTKTLVLVGLMGAGKTAIGTLLAQRLGVQFVDSDDEIVRAANMSISEIFQRDGEPFFRSKETQIITRLLQSDPHVLSTGGGAYMSLENQQLIDGSAVSVWLHADLETLWVRVREKGGRPLLDVADPKEKLRELYELRNPEYAKARIVAKSKPNQSKEAMVETVIQALLADPNSGLTKVQKHA